MTKNSAIRIKLFEVKKKVILFFSWFGKLQRVIKRSTTHKQVITSSNCFDVPIIINNRNRLTFLKMMVDQLRSFGYKNIYVLDNDSSYPPLLEYYKTTSAKVIYLKENLGYMALWQSKAFDQFKNGFYVYSDPDILMQDDCPKDFIYQLFKHLNDYTWKEKAGVALRIDDIPNHYKQKADINGWEKQNWEKQLKPDVYDALVDTTLALYKPLAFGNAEQCSAIRVGGKLTAKHLPWYINSDAISEEELFYKNTISKTSTYWSSK